MENLTSLTLWKLNSSILNTLSSLSSLTSLELYKVESIENIKFNYSLKSVINLSITNITKEVASLLPNIFPNVKVH